MTSRADYDTRMIPISANAVYWIVLIASFGGLIVSLFGIWNLLAQGLITTGMTDEVPMGIWLVFYIFFTGLSAGSFIVSTLAYVFEIEMFKPIGRRAVILALILLINGPIFLILDIGRPERVLNLFIYWNLTSVLAWGSRLLLLYPTVCFIYLWALTYTDLVRLAKEKGGFYRILSLGKTEITEKGENRATRLAKLMGLIGIPTALATHGYTGFLFSVISAHPLWNTPIMPILFLSSAIVSGAALLAMIVILTDSMEKTEDTVSMSNWSTLILTFLFVDGILLMTEFFTVLLADVEEHVKVWQVLISGDLWFAFWVVEIIIGFWVPLIIFLVPQLRSDRRAVFLASFLVLIGVFSKRMNLIVGGQLITSFTGQQTSYIPSLTELLISIGGIAALSFFFFVAWKILPLGRKISFSKTKEVS